MSIIAPSLLASNFLSLQTEIEMLQKSEADWYHLDIMDGNFVPNISFGFPVCEAIAKYSQKPLDYHLMIEKPERYLSRIRDLQAQIITVHLEACPHLHRVIQEIKHLGCQAGVALNPHTSVELLEDILPEIDLVCLMSVNPGFGGQQFIENTYSKIIRLKEKIQKLNRKIWIEVDGGVNLVNGKKLLQAGADVLVVGSFVFESKNPLKTLSELKKLA